MPVLTDPQRLEILKLLQAQPQMSQRDLAQALGVSLGKANYCLKALKDKGLVKLASFRNNPDKRQYAYLLTPAGVEEKTRITLAFLRRKVVEYETLEREIAQLRGDLKSAPDSRQLAAPASNGKPVMASSLPQRQTENQ
jgi:EPS-associated MarR family transcriptional regulator